METVFNISASLRNHKTYKSRSSQPTTDANNQFHDNIQTLMLSPSTQAFLFLFLCHNGTITVIIGGIKKEIEELRKVKSVSQSRMRVKGGRRVKMSVGMQS